MVDEAGFGHQIRGALGAGNGRPQHSLELLSSVPFQGVDGVPVELPLLLLGVIVQVAGIVDAVTHEVPVSLDHGLADFGEMLQHGHVQGHATANVVLVQHVGHAPEANPVAVVPVGVLLDVGIGHARPGVAVSVEFRFEFVVLDVGGDPQGDPGVVGPLDDGAVDDGAVINAVRRQWHGEHLPR